MPPAMQGWRQHTHAKGVEGSAMESGVRLQKAELCCELLNWCSDC